MFTRKSIYVRRSMLMTPGNRPDRIEAAEKLILGYQESIKKGFGTAVVDGIFVAVDLIGPAQRTLDLARHLKMTK